ncbi:MAG: glycosyltransferase [Phycisphaerales bacterium]|nr:MAG: glycosyltransferase [Phycisphaerales bacterium]
MTSRERVANDAMGPQCDCAFPEVSIVVIGRNEGERLVCCLESVHESDYPAERLELIYVDTDSTDDSCAVAEKLGAKVIRIQPERPCAAAARNAGLHVASHELIQFLDGDTMLNGSWLRKAVAALDDPSVVGVFGRVEEVDPKATIYNFWAHHDWYVPPGAAEFCGGSVLFRASVLRKADGFDESLIAGEEPDLCYRIRRDQDKAILSLDIPMALHNINMTRFRQYWRRCTRMGYAYTELARRYPGARLWGRVRWRDPGHVLIGMVALSLSLGLWSLWPAVIWGTLLALAVVRNGLRLRNRVGTFRSALLYSSHHYLAKLPITAGQCTYWARVTLRKNPQPLIEYR